MPHHPATPGSGVAAVITAFHPSHALVRACEAVRDQVDTVIVVDDGSGPTADEVLELCRRAGALVVRHLTNDGIGAALNTGLGEARRALGTGGHVLTLDQDSAVPAGYVPALLAAGRHAVATGIRVGMVGPAHVQSIGSMVAGAHDGVLIGREPIQSGLLIPLDVLAELGDFADELFIDGVDSEFYLRATTRGWSVVVAPGTDLAHRLGSEHAAAGLSLVHAAPFRYYFMARNRVILVRRYGRRAPGWCARAIAKDLRHLAVTTVLVPGRRARWARTLEGLRDGLRGKAGPAPT